MLEDIKEIIELGTYAPSGDNSQPWRFVIDNNRVDIFIIPSKDHPILNVGSAGTYLSLGALLENMKLAASTRNLTSEIKILPETLSSPSAQITFTTGATTPDPLAQYIKARHTNRKSYKRIKLLDEHYQILESIEPSNSNIKIKIISDRISLKNLADASSAMEQIALETKELHHFFFKDIIWTKKESLAGKEGLYIKSLELPAPIELLFSIIKHWKFAKIFNLIGFSKIASLGNAQTYNNASAHIAISIKSDTPQDFIEAGRTTQKIWLSATKLGLAVQPVTGIFYLNRKLQREGTRGISISKRNLKRAEEADKQLAKELNLGKDFCAMFLRVGYDGIPSARSNRQKPTVIIEK